VIVLAAVAQGQLDKGMVLVDQCEVDEVEEQLIQRFVQDRCKCDLGSPCCTTITVEHSWSVHCQMAELTHDELDFVVMAQVMMAGLETSPHHGQERGQSYIIFNHNGVSVCQKTFLFLHTMAYWHFKAIKASYMASGLVAMVHGNTGERKLLGLSQKQIQVVVLFILNYAGVLRENK